MQELFASIFCLRFAKVECMSDNPSSLALIRCVHCACTRRLALFVGGWILSDI